MEVTKGRGIWIFAGCFASMMLCAGAWLLLLLLLLLLLMLLRMCMLRRGTYGAVRFGN